MIQRDALDDLPAGRTAFALRQVVDLDGDAAGVGRINRQVATAIPLQQIADIERIVCLIKVGDMVHRRCGGGALIAALPDKLVTTATTGQGVIARATDQDVITIATGQNVVAETTIQAVIA